MVAYKQRESEWIEPYMVIGAYDVIDYIQGLFSSSFWLKVLLFYPIF